MCKLSWNLDYVVDNLALSNKWSDVMSCMGRSVIISHVSTSCKGQQRWRYLVEEVPNRHILISVQLVQSLSVLGHLYLWGQCAAARQHTCYQLCLHRLRVHGIQDRVCNRAYQAHTAIDMTSNHVCTNCNCDMIYCNSRQSAVRLTGPNGLLMYLMKKHIINHTNKTCDWSYVVHWTSCCIGWSRSDKAGCGSV